MDITILPTLNAVLNTIAVFFLLAGYVFIKKRNVLAHKTSMGLALLCSIAFLTSYLVYHFQMGSTKFPGQGSIRYVYFSILISHTVLAALVPPLALITVYRAWKNQLARHVRIARWTLPIWLYVSITGVIIYWMLYHLEK